MGATPFEIRSAVGSGTGRLTLIGELDLATAPQVEEAVRGLLARARDVLVDLSELTFIDSSGLRLFIDLSDRATVEGWTLRLTRPSEPASSVFRVAGADENLPFVGDSGTP
jgi:anti-sigma B factor antagonist